MKEIYLKIIIIAMLFLGESLAIFAEMTAAKTYSISDKPALHIFLLMLIVILLAEAFLILGYMFGFSTFKNIWVISVASITSILIMEPILAYTFFNQLPTKGAVVGFVLGVLGFISAMTY
ncbi:MAG: hypothetical protein JSW73_04125 [Candidatus Woesearchaeota archaeon]|nr:MAG: hypothetical protein JSW73_04125 [Candidatus Woesearchaeota archaeon]